MTSITGVENLLVGQDFAVPRTESTAGSGLQSKSSAESAVTRKVRLNRHGEAQAKAKEALAAKKRKKLEEAPKPPPKPMEPSRVVEIRFFKDGIFGVKQGAKRQPTTRHIDLSA